MQTETLLRPSAPHQRGRVECLSHQSLLLEGNPLGDPARRDLHVYLPPGYGESGQLYPVLWSLAAYTSAGPAHVAWRNHGETLPQRLDRLIAEERMPPAIVVFPDAYTSLGGNQYVNTPAMGPYADYLARELVPFVDEHFATIADPAARGLFGKSSGGFGALHLAMEYPEVWSAAASHAGDAGFDRVYLRDFVVCAGVLARHEGDLARFVRSFWRANKPGHADFHALMTLCLAASYSPEPDAPMGFELPFDLRTARLDERVWRRWLEFDPVSRVESHAETLEAMRGLWIDAGNRDQYFIQYGTRELHDRLREAGVDHHFEEFDGTHSGIDFRYDDSLPWLLGCLRNEQ